MRTTRGFLVATCLIAACGSAVEPSTIRVSNLDDSASARGGDAQPGPDADEDVRGGSGEASPEETSSDGWDSEVALSMDVIDVGTGLAILVRGEDFAMLFDAGSKEDIGRKKKNRVLAFLKERHPDLERLDHVILSHPHRDHVNLMAEVIDSYRVDNIWDVGLLHGVCPYRLFLRSVSRKTEATYRSAARGPGVFRMGFDAQGCRREELQEEEYTIVHGPRIEAGEKVELGAGVSMTFLYVDPRDYGDPNRNSMVVRLDVAGKRILLMSDAKAGPRLRPMWRPRRSSIEGRLLERSRKKIRADVMVVGHHGSHTSSREKFLDAVGARVFIVSAGKANFHGFTLPNKHVIEALEERGEVYRTDARDGECTTSDKKVGKKDDGRVGGCDNVRVVVGSDPESDVAVEVYPREL